MIQTENWLNCQVQCLTISGIKSSLRLATGLCWYWIQHCLTSSLVTWITGKTVPSNFTDDTKLWGVADRPEGCATSQRYLSRLGNWANRNFKEFQQEKQSLPLRELKPHVPVYAGSQLAEKQLSRELWSPGRHQADNEPAECTLVKKMANSYLGWISRNIKSRSRILPFHSALARLFQDAVSRSGLPNAKQTCTTRVILVKGHKSE